MISDQPVSVASAFEEFSARVKWFVIYAKEAAANGLTWGEFGELLLALLRLAVQAADTLTAMTGAEKKALVMAAVANLFDAVADKAVPLHLYPLWVVTKPAIRSLVLALASGAVEILLPMVRSPK